MSQAAVKALRERTVERAADGSAGAVILTLPAIFPPNSMLGLETSDPSEA